MEAGSLRDLQIKLHARRHIVTFVARWVSVLAGAIWLLVQGEARRPALLIVAAYAAFNAWSQWRHARGAAGRTLKVSHDVADALGLFGVAALSGGSRSGVALLLYPHLVSVSVRGGFRYALAFGVLDGALMALLALRSPDDPLGQLHVLALLWCALMGGTASAHLHEIQGQVKAFNRELSAANQQLAATVAAGALAQREQEQTLLQLRDSEERYRRLLQRIQDGVIIIQDGRVAYANEVLASMAGEPAEALVGRPFLDLAPDEDRPELAERYERWERSQAVSGELETRVRRASGEVRLVSLRAGSVDYEGRRSIIATLRDITRERQMELEVKAHAARLAVLNEIANAVNRSLRIGDILRVAGEEARRLMPFDRLTVALVGEQQGGLRLLGPGEEEGRRPDFPPAEVDWAFRQPSSWCSGVTGPAPPRAAELLQDGAELQAGVTLPLASKGRVIGSLNIGRRAAQPFSAADQSTLESVARHLAIALDNARLLEAVRRRSAEFETLLEISRGIVERLELRDLLPIITRSVNSVMGTINCLLLLRHGPTLLLAAQEGLEPELVTAFGQMQVGESLSGWVAEHGLPLVTADMRSDPRARFPELAERYHYRSFLCVPLKHGSEVMGTLEVLTREVRHFTLEEQAVMAAFADQAAVAISNARLYEQARAHLQQVTESNRRLEELDRLRQQYLRNVSHEFRTPLTVIKGYAEYLRDSPPSGEGALREVMRVMVESSDRVIDMVDTLLEVSRIEHDSAQQSLQIARLELRDIVQASIEPLRAAAERKRLSLEVDLPEQPLVLEGDGGLLVQVVRKLVDNAVKYSLEGGRVAVRCRHEDEGLRLEVEDAGIGIAPEHLPRIFDKFYMVDGGIARRAGGTGVGLYLVREIVRLHRGSVSVRSAPGAGSLFEVRLPRQYQPSEPEATVA